MKNSRDDLANEMRELKNDMRAFEQRLTIRFGFMLVSAVLILTAIIFNKQN